VEIQIDGEASSVYLRLRDGRVARTDEVAPGILLDYDDQGRVVGIELIGVLEPEER